MANTSTSALLEDTATLLRYANSSASLNFYMAHGGSNFGFWQGAGGRPNWRPAASPLPPSQMPFHWPGPRMPCFPGCSREPAWQALAAKLAHSALACL